MARRPGCMGVGQSYVSALRILREEAARRDGVPTKLHIARTDMHRALSTLSKERERESCACCGGTLELFSWLRFSRSTDTKVTRKLSRFSPHHTSQLYITATLPKSDSSEGGRHGRFALKIWDNRVRGSFIRYRIQN